MKIINLLTILFGFLTLIGPAIVLSKNSKSSKSNLLFLMALVTGPLWSISIGLFFLTDDLYVARIALNSIYTVSVIIAVLTFFFTKTLPYKTSSKTKKTEAL